MLCQNTTRIKYVDLEKKATILNSNRINLLTGNTFKQKIKIEFLLI